MTWILYPILVTALFHLGALATITRPLWSRYPRTVDKLMSCPACAGFWMGVAVAAGGGLWRGWSFAGLPGKHWATWIVCGLVALVTTPPLAWLHTWTIVKISESTGAGE